MKKTAVKILSALLMLSMVFSTNVFAANDETTSAWDSFLGLFSGVATSSEPVVQYRAHIQDLGDMPKPAGTYVTGPTEMGTRGQFLRMEGFWLKSSGLPTGTHLTYQVHVQNVGWMDWVGDDQFAGTQGDSQRIEAIKIKLVDATGNLATGYSVQYKGHVQDLGDLPANDPDYTGTTGWYADGQQLGTTGSSLRLEALQVQIISIKADMTAYNAAVAAAAALTEADYTAASWTALETALTDNVVTDANTQAEVDAATAAINAAIDALVKIPTAIEATATGASELTVTFNAAVTDTTKAVFAAKKGATTQTVSSVSWNDDKTVAELTLSSKLKEATYTVNVTGVATATLTDTVDVVDEALAKINFLSTNLVKSTVNNQATATYEALNQYGEVVTEDTLANGIVSASPLSQVSINDGVLILNVASQTLGDTFSVTLYDADSGVTTNATLTYVDKANAKTIAIGDVYNEDDLELNADNAGEPFFLLISLTDQYGAAITDPAVANSDLIVRSSDTTVITVDDPTAIETVTIDDVDYLGLPITVVGEADDSIITFVSTGSGTTARKTLTVTEGWNVDTIAIGTPDGTIPGATEINIPVDVVDTNGEAVTDIADMTAVADPTVTQDGAPITPADYTEEDGQIYITFTTGSVTTGTENLVVNVTTPTDNYATKVFKVYPDAEPESIVELSSSVSRSLLNNISTSIADSKFVVEDQYGNVMDDTTYDIRSTTAVDGFLIANGTEQVTITPDGTKTTGTVVFDLHEEGNTATIIDTLSVKFTTTAATAFSSYAIDDFGTIYATDANDAYAHQLKVYGVTSGGAKVLLPANEGYYTVATNTDYLKSVTAGNETMVYGENENLDIDSTTLPVSKAVTADVTINATGAKLTANGTVTVATPDIVTIQVVKDDYTGDLQDATLTNVTSGTTAGGAAINMATLLADITPGIDYVATDNYGVRAELVGTNFEFNTYGAAAIPATLTFGLVSEDVVFQNNGTNAAAVITYVANDSFNATINADGISSGNLRIRALAGNTADQSASTTALAVAGDKVAGETFNLSVTGAKNASGTNLTGAVAVTVDSDLESAVVFNANVTFAGGAATIVIPANVVTTAGAETLTVTIAGVTATDDVAVTVVPAAVDADESAFAATGTVSAPGTATYNTTVTVKDQYGNTITGLATGDFVFGTVDSTTITKSSFTEVGNGVYTVQLSNTADEVEAIDMTVDGIQLTDTITVTWN